MTINKVMVIGSGQMGSGIAQVFAQNGFEVVMNDIKDEFIERGFTGIQKNLSKSVAKERISQEDMDQTIARITKSTSYQDAADCDLVVEAATENPTIKLDIFKQLDEICKPEVILASNTSSLSLTSIAAATSRPDKVVGMHFFNPAPVMKLVEIIHALQTSEETVNVIKETAEKLQKTPVIVKDSPGFAVNRILIPMLNEAIFTLSEGVATAEEIDTGMKLGANHPMGPLALCDLIGLDVVLAVGEVLYTNFNDSKYRPPLLLKKLVEAKKLGMKTGEGFYKY